MLDALVYFIFLGTLALTQSATGRPAEGNLVGAAPSDVRPVSVALRRPRVPLVSGGSSGRRGASPAAGGDDVGRMTQSVLGPRKG